MAKACGSAIILINNPPDTITSRRLQLPARLGGCGIRSREAHAPAAFAASFAKLSYDGHRLLPHAI